MYSTTESLLLKGFKVHMEKCGRETSSSSISYDVKRRSCMTVFGHSFKCTGLVNGLPIPNSSSWTGRISILNYGTGCNVWLATRTKVGEAE